MLVIHLFNFFAMFTHYHPPPPPPPPVNKYTQEKCVTPEFIRGKHTYFTFVLQSIRQH